LDGGGVPWPGVGGCAHSGVRAYREAPASRGRPAPGQGSGCAARGPSGPPGGARLAGPPISGAPERIGVRSPHVSVAVRQGTPGDSRDPAGGVGAEELVEEHPPPLLPASLVGFVSRVRADADGDTDGENRPPVGSVRWCGSAQDRAPAPFFRHPPAPSKETLGSCLRRERLRGWGSAVPHLPSVGCRGADPSSGGWPAET
jgi:hypothetical protein